MPGKITINEFKAAPEKIASGSQPVMLTLSWDEDLPDQSRNPVKYELILSTGAVVAFHAFTDEAGKKYKKGDSLPANILAFDNSRIIWFEDMENNNSRVMEIWVTFSAAPGGTASFDLKLRGLDSFDPGAGANKGGFAFTPDRVATIQVKNP